MSKPILLLGAGASMDAGLPNAFDLTQRVYDNLGSHSGESKRLYGFVVAKLLTRQSRLGLSPFDKLNVEEVYDALKRLMSRESDALVEFVSSWDMIEKTSNTSFDTNRFANELGTAFRLSKGINGSTISADQRKLRDAGERIAKALKPSSPRSDLEYALRPYLETLVKCLTADTSKQTYLRTLTQFCAEHVAAVATLNYDTLIEQTCRETGLTYDYGLSGWNDRKYVRFYGSDVKLIKLHGSVNWFEDDDNIEVDPDEKLYRRRGLIFGGQGEKLVPHGPYLQLRHEFQRMLRGTSVFGIIGYSFRDRHLNAIIRAWASSRRKAKLIILDPGTVRLGSDVLSKYYTTDKDGRILKYNLEIEQISETASEGMAKFLDAMKRPPNPPIPDQPKA